MFDPGEYPADEILVPGELLVDCAGRADQVVSSERQADGDLIATWQDASVPVAMRYTPPEDARLADFPAPPEPMADNPSSLLTALRDAGETAEPASIRFALDHLELCGDSGTLSGTHSRQVLVRCGRSPTEPPPPTGGLPEALETFGRPFRRGRRPAPNP